MPKVRKLTQEEIRNLEATPPEPGDVPSALPIDATLIDDAFPRLAAWVYERGWIEIGQDDYSRSFIRVLDIGGMVWEGRSAYASFAAALHAADRALAEKEAAGEL